MLQYTFLLPKTFKLRLKLFCVNFKDGTGGSELRKQALFKSKTFILKPYLSTALKKPLPAARIILWASNCRPSSQTRVTSEKSASPFDPLRWLTKFSWKSSHFRRKLSEPADAVMLLQYRHCSYSSVDKGWLLSLPVLICSSRISLSFRSKSSQSM